MSEPTLEQIFGTNAIQDVDTLTISKNGLSSVGLVPTNTNNAESLLVAIILLSKNYLTENNFNSNFDSNLMIANGYSSFTNRNSTNYRTDQIIISLSKPDTSSLINPEDY
jgi:hypothetical protein